MTLTGTDAGAVPRPRSDPELRLSLPIGGEVFPPTITPDLLGFLRLSCTSAGNAGELKVDPVDAAPRLWAAGGAAELHVWSGGFHAFNSSTPRIVLARGTRRARPAWMEQPLPD